MIDDVKAGVIHAVNPHGEGVTLSVAVELEPEETADHGGRRPRTLERQMGRGGPGHLSWLGARRSRAPMAAPIGILLDIAGGGRRSHLARLGLDVTVADVSDVGLIQATQRCLAEDLKISTIEIDPETESIPAGRWDVITVRTISSATCSSPRRPSRRGRRDRRGDRSETNLERNETESVFSSTA